LLASRIKYTLLFDQNSSDGLGHILLVGPIGSGKTTILTKLAQQLRTIGDNTWPIMASGLLDFAGEFGLK
jgi:type IV secretory pathway VirB4 component